MKKDLIIKVLRIAVVALALVFVATTFIPYFTYPVTITYEDKEVEIEVEGQEEPKIEIVKEKVVAYDKDGTDKESVSLAAYTWMPSSQKNLKKYFDTNLKFNVDGKDRTYTQANKLVDTMWPMLFTFVMVAILAVVLVMYGKTLTSMGNALYGLGAVIFSVCGFYTYFVGPIMRLDITNGTIFMIHVIIFAIAAVMGLVLAAIGGKGYVEEKIAYRRSEKAKKLAAAEFKAKEHH